MSNELESQVAYTRGDIQAAIDAGMGLGEGKEVNDLEEPFVTVVPEGASLEALDLVRFAPTPRRKAGNYKAATVDAFSQYVGHHETESTTVWLHPIDGTVVGVLNDHGHGSFSPDWRDHRVTLDLRHTHEWEHWTGRDGTLGDQAAFAEHIEDGLTEIADPDGATLLEIAQTFHATTSAQFRQATRLRDGSIQVRYDEAVDAQAGTSGELAIPQEITLLLAPYVGEPQVELKARLRYRVAGGNLRIGYKLDRPERVLQEVLADIAVRVTEKFGDKVYLGSPPA